MEREIYVREAAASKEGASKMNAIPIICGIIVGIIGFPFSMDESKTAGGITFVCTITAAVLIAIGVQP